MSETTTGIALGSVTPDNSIPTGAGVLIRQPSSTDPTKFVFGILPPEVFIASPATLPINSLIATDANGIAYQVTLGQGLQFVGGVLSVTVSSPPPPPANTNQSSSTTAIYASVL